MAEVSYAIIEPGEKEDIVAFIKNNFFFDEPLNKSLVLGECKQLEIFSTESLADKLSFKAVFNGKIVGVIINAIVHRNSSGPSTDFSGHRKFQKIITLSESLEHECNIFGRFSEIQSYVDGRIICVSSQMQRMGIAGRLVDETLKLMVQKNIPLIYVQCSSFYSAKVLEKKNFREILSLKYEDYKKDGRPVFTPEKPHEYVKIFIKQVQK
ncbi:arylalkylamine N-acetyltransferase 1-like [Phlebotomus papatasi]|uniref:arylalkylamine N-acetyltransferase 1-like n=1 Tax=Phlebotomus papatasi TaxID=29031 RepID=UPI002483AE4C|nr:arylalkylamine N-acetyltransferase 1-like [Phlebotomus papatasi]